MHSLEIQLASKAPKIPTKDQFQCWVDMVLPKKPTEVVIRIVDEDEMRRFNNKYRKIQDTTNILSFIFEAPDNVTNYLLGDLLVCAPIVAREAQLQHKKLDHHWAHIIIHGLLHLLGYNHNNTTETSEMEELEIKFLQTIKVNNPYLK